MKQCFMIVSIIWIVMVGMTSQHQHSLKCLFDQLNVDLKEVSAKEKPDVPMYRQEGHVKGRLLTPNPTRAAFRMELDTTFFSASIQAGQNGASSTTISNLNFILKAMAVTQTFYQTRLQVGQTASISSPVTCVDFNPPSQSYANADLVLYVRYTTDASITYGATGKSCKYFSSGNALPDLLLMQGRPTVGRIIFNTYNVVDRESSLTNRVFQSLTSTALHETMHILGFDSTLYSTYLDPTTGNLYSSGPQILGSVNANRPATSLMSTPYVLAWAKAFFGCSSMTGMPLENQDGSGAGAGSHWQRTAMYDELMTGTSLGTAKYFSGLTFALLKDMGWYTVDDTFAGTSNFGYQKGCSFLTDACYGTTFSQFCSTATYPSTNSYCDSNFIGKAICSTDSALMADGCGMFGQYSSCIDANTQPTSYDIYTFQAYGANSFCLDSTLGSVVVDSKLRSRCYPYICNPSNITFTIGTYSITCLDTEAGVQKTLSALAGYLTCPVFTSFCTVSRKTCNNFCNQNGYCMDNVCNCNTGFYGNTCTQTICVSGQYYDPNSGTCGANCPPGYYTNKYSKSCQQCQSPCSECSGTPTNCVGCQPVNGVTMYYYNSACYAQCPTSTYPLGNLSCADCDTNSCLNCTGSPTTCTACQTPLYLSPPTTGSCGAGCGGSYPLQDEVNMKCVASCPSNLYAPGNGSCVYCSGLTYLEASSCVSNCTTGSYPDDTLKACMTCHTECNTCDGSYPENCTSCKSASGNPYLLLKMCWAICPKGFYANPSTGKCQVCPVQLRCTACTYNASNSSSYCTSCQYGTFYQASATACQTSCDSNQYKNTWNNSCSSCNPACATCNGPSAQSCTSCSGMFYLLTNSTGGYCLSVCPTQGYIQIGTTCQTCDPTCLTCNGISANQCADCATNYYYYQGYCRYVCPNGTYANGTTWQCLNCDLSCSYCFGSSNSSCTSCASGLYLYNFTCTNSCPNGMLPNQWNVCWQRSLALSVIGMILLFGFFLIV